jgi:hypothetical protein
MNVAPFRGSSGVPMCDKCIEHDKKIERYRRVSSSINDQLTKDGLKKLIADLEAQKAALHPDEGK